MEALSHLLLLPGHIHWDIKLLATLSAGLATYILCYAFYNVYLHPLAKYPGPLLWRAFRFPFIWKLLRGDLLHKVEEIHHRYGQIVRTAPNELSVSNPDGWKDIYAHRPGRNAFPKNPIWWGGKSTGQPESLINAEDLADHARMRRLLDPVFTPATVARQEALVQDYVDLLISRLYDQATKDGPKAGGVVNIVEWFNFTTFDIIGDLGFGEPFNCLENGKYHTWVSTVFTHFKFGVFIAAVRFYPWIAAILMRFIPKSVMKLALENRRLAHEKIHRRLNLESERDDFMSPVLKYNQDENYMSMAKVEGTFNIVIVAGSETTATILSGTTNHLTRNPEILHKLTSIVRDTFREEKDITFDATERIEYLTAVIKEGMRMCPSTPAGLPGIAPKGGETVCGEFIPGGTHISVHNWATHRSPANFHDPLSFRPERWLSNALTDPLSPYHNDKRYAVQIFSMGPRSCIGRNLAMAELRLVLSRLVWNFDVSPALKPDGSPKRVDWEKQKTYVLVEKQPFEVKLVIAGD